MVCGDCHSAHHVDCWADNGGCAIMGCLGGPGKSPTTEQPTAAMPPQRAAAAFIATPPTQPPRPAAAWPAGHVPQAPPPQAPPPANRSGMKGLVAALFVLALAVGGVAVALVVNKGTNTPPKVVQNGSTNSASQTPRTRSTPTPGVRTVTVITSQSTPTTSPPTSTPTSPSNPNVAGAGGSATSGADTAIDTYWNDVGSGDFTDAVAMETSSQQSTSGVSTFESEQPHVNIIWTAQPIPDGSGQATVRISFYAHNTTGSDQTCRHFVISSLMVQSGGSWLYGGSAPGTDTIDSDSDGNPNCPP